MAPANMNILVASLNFTSQHGFYSDLNAVAAEHIEIWSIINDHVTTFGSWLLVVPYTLGYVLRSIPAMFIGWITQPHVYAVIIAWAATFTIVVILLSYIGFGPRGVIAGTFAAAFQASWYGAWTPAAGVFATLTSLAMLGRLVPVVTIGAASIATTVAGIVWASGVER